MAEPQAPVVVLVKSAWSSKINWIAGLGGAATILTELAPILPAEWQPKVSAFIALLTAISVWYTRTFQTNAVTPSSLTEVQKTQDLNVQSLAASRASKGGV